jgi:ABC-type glutathione transport system ATPase component
VRFESRDLMAMTETELRAARRHLQIVFQDPGASVNQRMTVGAIIEEPLVIHGLGDAASRRARVRELLLRVGLAPEHAIRHPHSFSGGQRQRIGIARALALNAKFLVCDEPVSALDVSVQAQILNLLRDLQRELGVSYLFITHNIGVVEYIADHIVVMKAGRVEEQGACGEVLANPRRDYTRQLLAAVPRLQMA